MQGMLVRSRIRFWSWVIVGLLLAQSQVAVADEDAPVVTRDANQGERATDNTLGWTLSVTPIQVSLVNPAQIFSAATPVGGIRVNLIYGEQASLWGIDVGSLNRTTSELRGVQIGFWNWDQNLWGVQQGIVNWVDKNIVGFQAGYLSNKVDGDFRGFQYGTLMNVVEGDFAGVQLGGINWASKDFVGLQAGFFNYIDGSSRSVQVGFLNQSRSLKGVQVGVINLNVSGGPLRFAPVINVGW